LKQVLDIGAGAIECPPRTGLVAVILTAECLISSTAARPAD
jgi:hypothetical protein